MQETASLIVLRFVFLTHLFFLIHYLYSMLYASTYHRKKDDGDGGIFFSFSYYRLLPFAQ